MFKKIVVVISLIIFMISFSSHRVYAQDLEGLKSSVDTLMDSLSPQVREDLMVIGVDAVSLAEFDSISFSSISNLLGKKIPQESKTPLSCGAVVIGIIILTSILENYRDSLKRTSIKESLNVVSTLCITSTIVVPVIDLIKDSVLTVTDASNFMLLYIPIMLAILAFSGHAVSGASYYSFMILACEGVSQLSSKFIAPLLNVYLSFCVSASVTDRINLHSFLELFSKIIKWLISFTMTVFSALLTIRGMITTAYDSVTARAVRFTMSSFIPIVGAALSESYKTIQGSINLIRTGAGVFVILAIFVVFVPTIIRCVAWLFALNVCKSIAQTMSVNTPVGLIASVCSVVSTVFAITVCIMAIFIISTALLITLGGGV